MRFSPLRNASANGSPAFANKPRETITSVIVRRSNKVEANFKRRIAEGPSRGAVRSREQGKRKPRPVVAWGRKSAAGVGRGQASLRRWEIGKMAEIKKNRTEIDG